ncbi:MAG: hypothetical protein ISN28_12420 [Ectothiorhodospiraceae bacterium AqS1]|nr:hypothetical protein [Ectothiorhodospiraceae bacterium AqS1]
MTTSLFRPLAAIALAVASAAAVCQFEPVEEAVDPFDPDPFYISTGFDRTGTAAVNLACRPGVGWRMQMWFIERDFDDFAGVRFKLDGSDPFDAEGFRVVRSDHGAGFEKFFQDPVDVQTIARSKELGVRTYDIRDRTVTAWFSTRGLTEALATLKTKCNL